MGRINKDLLHIEARKELLSRGFKVQVSSWDRTDLSRMALEYIPLVFEGAQMEVVLGEYDVWQVTLGVVQNVEPYDPNHVYELQAYIVHAFKCEGQGGIYDFATTSPDVVSKEVHRGHFMAFDRLFLGKVRSTKELLRVMEQVGCPTQATIGTK